MMHVRYKGVMSWCGKSLAGVKQLGADEALVDLNAAEPAGRCYRLCQACLEAMLGVLRCEVPVKPKPAFDELVKKTAELDTPSVMAVPADDEVESVDLAEQICDFDPDDSAAPTCERCGDSYRLREGEEPTVFCDPCAQVAIKQLALQVRELRTELTEVRGQYVSPAWVLNQLAGLSFPKQGRAHDFMQECMIAAKVDPCANEPCTSCAKLRQAFAQEHQRAEALLDLVGQTPPVVGGVCAATSGIPHAMCQLPPIPATPSDSEHSLAACYIKALIRLQALDSYEMDGDVMASVTVRGTGSTVRLARLLGWDFLSKKSCAGCPCIDWGGDAPCVDCCRAEGSTSKIDRWHTGRPTPRAPVAAPVQAECATCTRENCDDRGLPNTDGQACINHKPTPVEPAAAPKAEAVGQSGGFHPDPRVAELERELAEANSREVPGLVQYNELVSSLSKSEQRISDLQEGYKDVTGRMQFVAKQRDDERTARARAESEISRLRPVVEAAEHLERVVKDAHQWPIADVPSIIGSETVCVLCKAVRAMSGGEVKP